MKREYLKLFSFMIGISLILASVIFFITSNAKAEKERQIEEEKRIIDEIGDIYKKFTDKAEEFADKHEEFIKAVDEDTAFFSVVPDNYGKMVESAKEYEKFLVEIDDMDSYLEKNCKKTYSDKATNTNCIIFVRNKEKLTNTFIEDIKYLNHRVEKYNEWTDQNNASVIAQKHYDKIGEYKAEKYTDYVDLDGDGVLLGANSD